MAVGCFVAKPEQIVLVHRNNVVEAFEIGAAHASGTNAIEGHAAPLGRRARAMIGRLADMVGVGAGRIDFDTIRETGALDMMTEHALSGR